MCSPGVDSLKVLQLDGNAICCHNGWFDSVLQLLPLLERLNGTMVHEGVDNLDDYMQHGRESSSPFTNTAAESNMHHDSKISQRSERTEQAENMRSYDQSTDAQPQAGSCKLNETSSPWPNAQAGTANEPPPGTHPLHANAYSGMQMYPPPAWMPYPTQAYPYVVASAAPPSQHPHASQVGRSQQESQETRSRSDQDIVRQPHTELDAYTKVSRFFALECKL